MTVPTGVTEVLQAVVVALLVYYLVHNVLFAALVVRAAAAIGRELAWPDRMAHDLSFANPLTPAVSVVVPAHDEEAGIVQAVRALLELRYPRVQIVVVDDGSTDATAELLVGELDLVLADVPVQSGLPQVGATLETYVSREHPGLVLLRKESVGRRSDAVNAGLRLCTGELICMIDADSVLEPDALLHVVQPFVDDDRVVAAGGVVLPSNGVTVHRGRVTSVGVPRTLVERTQVLEYLRAFLVGRSGWSSLNGLLIISGAFGVFRRDVLERLGGLDPQSLAEDADLVVATHRLMRDEGEPYAVAFVPEPVCWTETPWSVRVLARQRIRWSRGLAELLAKHRGMIGRPRYGVLGVATMPYFLAFELVGPVAEILGALALGTGLALGLVDPALAVLYLSVSVGLSILVSLGALLVEEVSFGRYPRTADVGALVVAAFLEPVWYHPLHVWWRAVGLWRAVTRSASGWGQMTRRGFAVRESQHG